ncbi:serine hydrolase [Nonomuraea sp. KM90]|uniref:serine hydrolase n=1 Tax=Nonomuraea sp. KM90 TaxID=3457428 RepID=UPI003FCEBC81
MAPRPRRHLPVRLRDSDLRPRDSRRGPRDLTAGATSPLGPIQTNSSGRPAVTPTSEFRLASLGKHITATAILPLAQEGLLNLGDPVTKWLRLEPMAGKTADPRLARILFRNAHRPGS